jgi:hypothetical protein
MRWDLIKGFTLGAALEIFGWSDFNTSEIFPDGILVGTKTSAALLEASVVIGWLS